MPENAPEKTSRVVRVQGEKGERYEEVYPEETLIALKHHPAILEARIAWRISSGHLVRSLSLHMKRLGLRFSAEIG